MTPRNHSVCVVIPAHNASQTVGAAVCSVADQLGVEVYIIVVDHGSTDNTAEAARQTIPTGKGAVITLSRKPSERASASRPLNVGLDFALHQLETPFDWAMRLDADDLLGSQTSLVSLCDAADTATTTSGKPVPLVCGALAFFDQEKYTAFSYGVNAKYTSRRHLLLGATYSVPHHCVLFSRRVLENVKRARGTWFDESIGYGEDFDMTTAAVEAQDEGILFVDSEITYLKRLDGATQTRTMRLALIAKDHLAVFRKHNSLRRGLLVLALVDIAFRATGLTNSRLRRLISSPGEVYGAQQCVDYERISERINNMGSLARGTPAVCGDLSASTPPLNHRARTS